MSDLSSTCHKNNSLAYFIKIIVAFSPHLTGGDHTARASADDSPLKT
jgi:hypothetical protein